MYVTNLLRRFLLLGFSFSLIAVQRERGNLKLQIMQYSDAIELYLEEIVKIENQLIVLQEDSAEYDRLLLAKKSY